MTDATPIAKAATSKRAYFLDDYADETVPCGTSLAEWAAWLSRPDPDWGRDAAASDGDAFEASVMRFEADIVATPGVDGWSFSRDLAGATFLAVRFGEGLGWSEDDIVDMSDPQESLREMLVDFTSALRQVEYIAVGVDEPSLRLTYRTGTPPYFEIEPLLPEQVDEVAA